MQNEGLANHLMQARLRSHGLAAKGWTYEIVDDLDGLYGFTDVPNKHISLSRAFWPTLGRNVKEQVLHEIAHALCSHGDHNLEWWDKYTDIGGKGVWVEHPDRIKTIGVVVTY